MRIDPEIAALAHDPAKQHCGQEEINRAVKDWKNNPALSAIHRQFSRYAAGDPLETLNALQALVSHVQAAGAFVSNWIDVHVHALKEAPLGQMPYRHSYATGFATMQLLVENGASLVLSVYEERIDPVTPTSAIFSDREQHEIVIAGKAQGLLSRCEQDTGTVTSSLLDVTLGDRLQLDCNREVRQWSDVKGRLVLLQLSRTPQDPAPTREIQLEDSSLLMQSDGNKQTSQSSVALAVLGALQRHDAVPVMEELSASGPAHLRWEAVRQMLTLDPFKGISVLDRMAQDPSEDLAVPAHRLAEQLRMQYPALRHGKAA